VLSGPVVGRLVGMILSVHRFKNCIFIRAAADSRRRLWNSGLETGNFGVLIIQSSRAASLTCVAEHLYRTEGASGRDFWQEDVRFSPASSVILRQSSPSPFNFEIARHSSKMFSRTARTKWIFSFSSDDSATEASFLLSRFVNKRHPPSPVLT